MRHFYPAIFIVCVAHAAVAISSPDVERLVPFDRSLYVMTKGELSLSSPRLTSQDTLGICFAHVAATMMQMEQCRFEGIADCSSVPDDKMFSPLDLARMQSSEGDSPSAARSNYKGINFGGNPVNAIRLGALLVKQSANQACISLDKVLEKMKTRADAKEAQAALWNGLEIEFKNAKKLAEGKENCEDCLSNIYTTAADKIESTLQKDLNLKSNKVQVAKAFAAKTYSQFLNELLGAKDCVRPGETVKFKNHENVDYVSLPKENEVATPDSLKEKIISVLRSGRPVALNGICYANTPPANCPKDKFHAVVVAGYRQVCVKNGPCKDSFKVLNSWGQGWQNENDGGWISADNALAATDMRTGAISYFEDKK